MNPVFTRRGLFTAGGTLSLGALLTACGVTGQTSGGGSWSFTDDRGEKATVEGTPDKVVAYIGAAAALWDYGVRDQIVGVFGPSKGSDGEPDVQAGDIDVDAVTALGEEWGEFNVEKYANLRPQLLVSTIYQEDVLWHVPEESLDQITKLAPGVGIAVSGIAQPGLTLSDVLDRFMELAEKLGGDLEAKEVADAIEEFETASERLKAATESNKGIKVLPAAADNDLFYALPPDTYPDLMYFQELGVEFVVPDDPADGFSEEISWENVDKYEADILFMDNRSHALQPEELTDRPTWMDLPAVKADQVIPWATEPRFSHAGMSGRIDALAEAIESADKVI